jgi:hypothetical protein|tara:strand:+ start:2672 stop:2908 length:237 start_codon:yes stop_codon:yes gene_type:complete
MAWVDVPNSNNIWEYDNAATVSATYSDSAAGANSTVASGIRTYTKPGTSDTVQTYIKTRKKGTTVDRGELSKTYYDAQ